MKKNFLTGLTVSLLSLILVLAGCEGPTGADGAAGGGGGGLTAGGGGGGLTAAGPIATTLAGVQAYFDEGNPVVYLLGTGTIGGSAAGDVATLTIGVNQTLVVTSYTDLNARSVTAGSVGGITVAAGGTLTLGGDTAAGNDQAKLGFLEGTTFKAEEGAIITFTAGNAEKGTLSFASAANVADAATFTAIGAEEIVIDGQIIADASELGTEDGQTVLAEAAKYTADKKAVTIAKTVAVAADITDTIKGDVVLANGVTVTAVTIGGTGAGTYLTQTNSTHVALQAANITGEPVGGGADLYADITLGKGSVDFGVRVAITVEPRDLTADLSFGATTTATPSSGLVIGTPAGTGKARTLGINVPNTTTSVIFKATKTATQTITPGGTDSTAVSAGTAGGTTADGTTGVWTVDTTNSLNIALTGGSKVFTLVVTETDKSTLTYTVTVTVAEPVPFNP